MKDHNLPSGASSDDSDLEIDVVQIPENPTQTSQAKELRKQAKDRDMLQGTMQNMIELLKSDHTLFYQPLFASIRDFVAYAIAHPDKYMIGPASILSVTNRSISDVDSGQPNLTPGFIKKLSQEFYTRKPMATSKQSAPLVKVIEKETKYRHSSFTFDSRMTNILLTTLTVIDGDNNSILVKCASQLNSMVGSVVVGSVLRLHLFSGSIPSSRCTTE